MRIISINVGQAKEVIWKSRIIETGIFKYPVMDTMNVNIHGIFGDVQSDLINHGGEYKAIYAYPFVNYQYWQNKLPNVKFENGIFGENLTIDGDFSESNVYIGDCFKIGTVELMAVQPRIPCFKLGIRFDNPEIIKIFLASRLSGVYFKVIKEGKINPYDEFILTKKSIDNVSIADIFEVISFDNKNIELMKQYMQLEFLAPNVKDLFRQRVGKILN